MSLDQLIICSQLHNHQDLRATGTSQCSLYLTIRRERHNAIPPPSFPDAFNKIVKSLCSQQGMAKWTGGDSIGEGTLVGDCARIKKV